MKKALYFKVKNQGSKPWFSWYHILNCFKALYTHRELLYGLS